MSLSILSIVGQIGVDNRYIGKEGRKGENNKESLLLLQKWRNCLLIHNEIKCNYVKHCILCQA